MRTLVLNAGYEPLSVVSFRRGITLVMAGKATVISSGPVAVTSATGSYPRPSVILLGRYVRPRAGRSPHVSRRAVLRRDGWRCAYCGHHASTIDHVVPRSRGGKDTWENLVACCQPCNTRKGDATPPENGWQLKINPRPPRDGVWLTRGLHAPHPDWEPYLPAVA